MACDAQGASLSTYLLEKSRITHIGNGERAYHIFYELLRGLSAAELKGIQLSSSDCKSYSYLKHGDQVPAKHDAHGLAELKEALSAQNVSDAEQKEYWQLMAGVMLLGNVTFDPAKTESAQILSSSMQYLKDAEQVLGLQPDSVGKALTKRKIKAGAEFVDQDLKLDAANDGRDALSKAIYSKLFDYLILQINQALAAGEEVIDESKASIIGVVDIFGFEVFEVNSLEQLCINFTNEKLQALFTATVFEQTLQAYKADGIDADEITYVDNKALIAIFEVPNTGLWNLLSEECMVPKGSDKGFTEKLHDAQAKGSALSIVKGASRSDGFQVEHFAGRVTYKTTNWLDKNKDPLSGDLVILMQFSNNSVLKRLFEDTSKPEAGGKGAKFKSTKFKGVVDTFRTQLTSLYDVLQASQLHFIRCFKPNDRKSADTWDESTVSRQLHTSGVLDALRVARTGYPDRMTYAEFASYFGDVAQIPRGDTRSPREKTAAICANMQVTAKQHKLGRERIFMALGVLDGLKTKRTERMAKVVIRLQAGARAMKARKLVRQLREIRLKAQKAMETAAAGTDIPALAAAIAAAKSAGVHLAPKGKAAVDKAEATLARLKQEEAERLAATQALEKAMAGFDMAALAAAIAMASKVKGVDAVLMQKAQTAHAKLVEEERLRKEEEERLKKMAAEQKAIEEKRLAEERKKRQEEEENRRKAEAKADADAKAKAEADKKAALMNADKAAVERAKKEKEEAEKAAIQAEQKAIQAEEELRARAIDELARRKITFKSEPSDVLEYAVYLGMDLNIDLEFLWIADEALQAEDPEGWDQAESPNGDMYYIHTITQQVLWQHPLDYSYQQRYLAAKGQEHDADILNPKQYGAPSAPSAGSSMPTAPPPAPRAAAPAPPAPMARQESGVQLQGEAQVRARLQQLLGTRHTELKAMLVEPSCTQRPVQCYVLRTKSRLGSSKFDFYMSISASKDMYCFTGKKTSGVYVISLDQDGTKAGENIIGNLKVDKKAMEYTLYDGGAAPGDKKAAGKELRREFMHVHFINSLRNRNPGAMEVALPAVDADGAAALFQPQVEGKDTLEERIKKEKPSDATIFKNREPKWNEETQIYQLDFRGRATHASCKNIQLTYKGGGEDSAQMLMGKVDENKFNVDFNYPFSALQAFAFSLVIFDNSSSSMGM